jgi:hypothetical protein
MGQINHTAAAWRNPHLPVQAAPMGNIADGKAGRTRMPKVESLALQSFLQTQARSANNPCRRRAV